LVLALVALLGLQVLVRQRQRGPLPLTGPQVGEPLPNVELSFVRKPERHGLSEILRSDGQCSLLVFISTYCGICRKIRYTWPDRIEEWAKSAQVHVRVIWLGAEREESLVRFFSETGNPIPEIARISSDVTAALTKLGVYGTPTTYLTDRSGRLRIGTMGDQLPPEEETRRYCQ